MLVVRTKVLTFKEEKKKAQLQAPRYNSLFKFVPRAQKTNKQKTLPKSALQALDTRAPVSPWFPLSSEQHVCVSASSEPKARGEEREEGRTRGGQLSGAAGFPQGGGWWLPEDPAPAGSCCGVSGF